MYHFSYFKAKDQQEILEFMNEHPFVFLTSSTTAGKPVATQIPVIIEERNGELFLQGHIMRKTDHHKCFEENENALAVFTGPSCYVSASWYSDQSMGSTWNYMSVHAEGKIRFMSADELLAFMRKFTLKFEGGNTASKTIVDNLAPAYLDKMMSAIVGIEIKIERLENVFKLSQNRDETSFNNIIQKLEAIGGESAMVAGEMRRRVTLGS